jgi:hypothetical protein
MPGSASERLRWAVDTLAVRPGWLGDVLRTKGFAVHEVLVGDLEPSPAVCVLARPG